jgi:hypothetical protein
MSNVARSVERTVFDDAFANDNNVMQKLYGRYEQASTFFMVFDRDKKKVAGVLRVISNSDNGIMTLNEAPQYIDKTQDEIAAAHELDEATQDAIWDVGTLAVLPEYRGKMSGLKVSTMLYRAYFLAGRALQVKKLTAIIDPRARRNAELLGIPLENLAGSEPFDYEGSKDSTAVIGHFPDFEASVNAQAAALREKAKIAIGDLLRFRIGKILFRKIAARTAGMLATGEGIDEDIYLPLSAPRRLPSSNSAVL